MPNYKVEIGFDAAAGFGDFFTLDDPVKGQLGSTTYVLSGDRAFVDVTSSVRRYSIRRGKSRQLDRFTSGQATVEFNNLDRKFDPTYAASPYYGQITPKREVKISVNDLVQYVGTIDDWNLRYEVGGLSTAELLASDGFAILNGVALEENDMTPELSGARVEAILNSPEVSWPVSKRNIDTGFALLGDDTISEGTNALSYLQLVEQSEAGTLFVAKDGRLTFHDRRYLPASSDGLTFADDGTGIGYADLEVTYGSELLYNQVSVSTLYTVDPAIANDLSSQGLYGVLNLTLDGLLNEQDTEAEELAGWLVSKYGQPEFRFESLNLELNKFPNDVQRDIAALELDDVVRIIFTPNGISPAIDKYAQIVRIDHSADPNSHKVSLGFSTLDFSIWIWDDPVFGRLDFNALAF